MIIMILIPLSARATSPFPLSTNGVDWEALLTANNPISHLWLMAQERYKIFPYATNEGRSEATMSCSYRYPAWYSNQVVTVTNVSRAGATNIYVYTNKIALYATGSISNDLYYSTGLVSTVQVSCTNQTNGVTVQTVMVPVDYGNYLYKPYAAVFGHSVNHYVLTNDSVGGTFDSWFDKTNSSGVHPSDFPACYSIGWGLADPARLFSLTLGTNYGVLTETDEWGVVHGPSDGAEFAFSRDLEQRRAVLAETAFTNGGWDYLGITTISTNPPSTNTTAMRQWPVAVEGNVRQLLINMRPVLTYATTGSVPAIDVTLWGRIQKPPYVSDGEWSLWTQDATETVTIGGSNTALVTDFVSVTNMTAEITGAQWGDVITVQYTNGPQYFFGIQRVEPQPQELDVTDLNERWDVLRQLCWGAGPVLCDDWYTITYHWSGISYTNWEQAKAICAASTPDVTTNDITQPHPAKYTTGGYAWDVWSANAYATKGYAIAYASNGIATPYFGAGTSVLHDVDFYYWFNPQGTWDEQGFTGFITNHFTYYKTLENTYNIPATNTLAVGDNIFPPNWPSDPFIEGGGGTLGWECGAHRALFRFDVEGGFTKF